MGDTKISGLAVAAIGAGALFAYAGVKGYSIPRTVQNLIQGSSPSGQPQATPVTTPVAATAAAVAAGGGPGSAAVGAALGGRYSNSQLQSLWMMAGGSPGKAAVAACIADHESQGDPGATSPNPDGGINVGLWQLDTKGKGAGYTVAQLQDPLTNARAAVAGSSNGTDWSAWSTAAGCGA